MAKNKMYDAMRSRERQMGGMISEDRSAMANLPQQAMMKEYPRNPYYNSGELDDTIRGIDRQMSDDAYSRALKKRGSSDPMY